MYLTQTNVVRHLTKKQYEMLVEMCRYSNNLYNYGLYCVKQHYFNTKTFLPYEGNYHVCKGNENYKLLQAGVSQQVLRIVDRSFKSFFNLTKKAKGGDYRFQDINLPRYRKKGGLFVLVFQKNSIAIKDGYFKIPMSRQFRKLHGDADISVPFPSRLEGREIKEVRLLPCGGGRAFKIQYVYELPEENLNLNRDNYVSIDLGVDNLATCVSCVRTPYIVDGRKLKSINWRWNKEKARLQATADKQGIKGGKTRRILDITEKRNRRIDDVVKKAARHIIDDCIEHDIGTVIVGYSKGFKRNVKLGKGNNQNFVQIPMGKLRLQLKNLCARYGMEYIEQEESYTSKSSYLDKDTLPEYKPERPYLGSFSGKRVHRGLYKAKDGTTINADVNAAANIARKVSGKHLRPCMGLLASPQRIRLD